MSLSNVVSGGLAAKAAERLEENKRRIQEEKKRTRERKKRFSSTLTLNGFVSILNEQ